MAGESSCENCGAAIHMPAMGAIIHCDYCGSTYSGIRGGAEDSFVARTDFLKPDWGGWRYASSQKLQDAKTGNGLWWIDHPPDLQNHPLLVAPGQLDDFEIFMQFRTKGKAESDSVFFRGRGGSQGAMICQYYLRGQICLGWQKPDHQWQPTILTTNCDESPEEWQSLRWSAKGPKHKVFWNGHLLLSTSHPEILQGGHLDIRVQALETPVLLEIKQVLLRDS